MYISFKFSGIPIESVLGMVLITTGGSLSTGPPPGVPCLAQWKIIVERKKIKKIVLIRINISPLEKMWY